MANSEVDRILDIEVQTVSDEVFLANWAVQNKISIDVIEKLKVEGFTSMDAMKLIDRDDLCKPKLAIPRGQQKLVLAAVQKFIQTEAPAQTATAQVTQTAVGQTAVTQADGDLNNQSESTGITYAARNVQAQISPDNGMTTTIETSVQPSAHARAGSDQLSTSGCQNDDAYIRALLQQFRAGQGQNNGTNVVCFPNSGESVNNQLLNGLGIQQNGPEIIANRCEPILPTAGPNSVSQSWRDPQIYLQAAASGKSSPSYYDITEFVTGNVEEEIVVGGNGSQQVILKSGPKKPKLESVTLAQWSVANLAILYRLLGDGKLDASNILDYLSYTTKICQLVQKFNLVSVLMYDREYRKLQASHGFRWGTDIPHLHSVHLQARPVKQSGQYSGKGHTGGSGNHTRSSYQGPITTDGKVICKLFNSRGGCHYKDCKFVHQCSQPGCQQKHPAVNHTQSKNM